MFRPSSTPPLPLILTDLASADANARRNAANNLSQLAKSAPNRRAELEPHLRRLLGGDGRSPQPLLVHYALLGLQSLLPADETFALRGAALRNGRAEVVQGAVWASKDPRHIPALLAVLARQSPPNAAHPTLQIHTMQTISRLKPLDANAADAMLSLLVATLRDPNPEVRLAAIDALGIIGDPRAIPHLEPLVNDRAVIDGDGDRSTPRQVGEVARFTAGYLKNPRPAAGGGGGGQARSGLKPAHALLHYLPLALAVATAPWFIVMVMANLGYKPHGFNHYQVRTFYLGCAVPSLAGLAAAAYVYPRRHGSPGARTSARQVFLLLGAGLCLALAALFTFLILNESPHPGEPPPAAPPQPAPRIDPANIPRFKPSTGPTFILGPLPTRPTIPSPTTGPG